MTEIFEEYCSGIETQNDKRFIHFENDFKQEINEYDSEKVKKIAYKPFDNRYCYYDIKLLGRARFNTMQHMLKGDNLGLVFERGHGIQNWYHIFISKNTTDGHLIGSKSYLSPLYLYKSKEREGRFDGFIEEEKIPNFKPEFAIMVKEKFGNKTPEEVLAFIYASLHSKKYREEYLELLKIDFPRINFNVSIETFEKLSQVGLSLIKADTLEEIPNLKVGSFIRENQEDIILDKKSIKFNEKEKKLYLTENKESYFLDISNEIWQFTIGGYQVLDNYLKVRNERILKTQDIQEITNIIKILAFTIEKMGEIDNV